MSAQPAAHEHRWRGVLHMDGCHWYSWSYVCDCGAKAYTRTERDLVGDPYSAVWMDGDERDEPCVRCEQLLAGAKPDHVFEITPAAKPAVPVGEAEPPGAPTAESAASAADAGNGWCDGLLASNCDCPWEETGYGYLTVRTTHHRYGCEVTAEGFRSEATGSGALLSAPLAGAAEAGRSNAPSDVTGASHLIAAKPLPEPVENSLVGVGGALPEDAAAWEETIRRALDRLLAQDSWEGGHVAAGRAALDGLVAVLGEQQRRVDAAERAAQGKFTQADIDYFADGADEYFVMTLDLRRRAEAAEAELGVLRLRAEHAEAACEQALGELPISRTAAAVTLREALAGVPVGRGADDPEAEAQESAFGAPCGEATP